MSHFIIAYHFQCNITNMNTRRTRHNQLASAATRAQEEENNCATGAVTREESGQDRSDEGDEDVASMQSKAYSVHHGCVRRTNACIFLRRCAGVHRSLRPQTTSRKFAYTHGSEEHSFGDNESRISHCLRPSGARKEDSSDCETKILRRANEVPNQRRNSNICWEE
eukprot:gb/GECG01001488.1/.p1 GENE.gb/GECG01001488.1/~~gb/GECG01001488.1/.p1  ORF type:complete len:166 (+),score=18.40 gb/GECG01001488.1/:1-498(+)